MVADSFTDGAKLALIVKKGEVGMVLADPAWHLPADRMYPIRIAVDGSVYAGTAQASADGRMMVVRGLTRDFLQALYHGNAAEVAVAGSRWNLILSGAAQVIDEALARG